MPLRLEALSLNQCLQLVKAQSWKISSIQDDVNLLLLSSKSKSVVVRSLTFRKIQL
jgi:hypothetical protein